MSTGGGMSEEKDPAIKLFGKTITLTENGSPPLPDRMSDLDFQILENADPKDMCRAITKTEVEDGIVEESGHREKSSVLGDDKEDKTPRDKDEAQVNTNLKEDNTEVSSTGEENVLKKPDKVLPCPRCSSFDTKFCYFNNYNVNQPRHYCRNCQRYWTAGGTMRKVPVGAGRRKNKQLSTQHSQILVPIDALPSTRDASPHLLSCDESPIPLKRSAGNKNLPNFCLEKTPCQSMETVSLRDQKSCANICSITKTTEEPSHCGSLMTSSSVHEDETHEKVTVDEQCVFSPSCNILRPQHDLQCYPIPQWDSPWNPCIPMQFVPAPYWGLPYVPVRMGNKPLAGSSNNSQTLDKHSRDEDLIEAERSNKRVIVPKTLRLDDPDEASKSTVWETLGFKPCVSKPPETGTKSNGHQLNAPAVLEANPVALCRSQTFQEST